LSAPENLASLVAVAGLAKRFGKTMAVRDVSISVRRGDLVGLVGANGGGKTTTLRMIAGFLRADAGSGTLFGGDLFGPRQARIGRIGYMSQRLALYPDLSVRENLHFRARAHGLAEPTAAIAAAVDRYRLSGVIDKRVSTLSGGWARRAQFVATVLHAPPLLLLDEPTAGLDVATRTDIWNWFDDLAQGGCGIVVSTHDLGEAERCDTIVPFHEGRAYPADTPANFIMTQGAPSLEHAILSLARAGC
jgi:ABC-type multidrug transport system ATPase subunit